MIEQLIDRLSQLPLSVLYPSLAFLAAIENIVPPLPTDLFVALGSFLAARDQGNPWISWAVTWGGNVLGAAGMFIAGRYYGHAIFHRALVRWGGPEADRRLGILYQRYGVFSLFVSRFLPGIRALVPVFGGAAGLPFLSVIGTIAVASGLWYGFLAFIAFRAARSWDALQESISEYNRVVFVMALLTIAGFVAFLIWRRRRATWTPDVTTHERLDREKHDG